MGFPPSSSSSTFLLALTLAFSCFASHSEAKMNGTFTCHSTDTCRALVGFAPPNDTTFGALQDLFSVPDLRSLLGANNLSLSTQSHNAVSANRTIRIPIPCTCSNGTGLSDRVPSYTVKKDDTLSFIAAQVYMNLLTYGKIVEVNRIKDENKIEVGQKFWIPLPCSCDQVGGQDVVHYAHVVKSGSSVAEIATQFRTDEKTLLKLNGLADTKQLLADLPFDVPLKACNSSVTRESLDYPFRVSNGTYAFTANNCVKCMCDAANNWTLQCEPSLLRPFNWTTCPSMRCGGSESLTIGDTTTSSCGRTRCAYSGYSNRTINSAVVTDSTCAAPSDNSHAYRTQLNWNFIFISAQLFLLCLHLYV